MKTFKKIIGILLIVLAIMVTGSGVFYSINACISFSFSLQTIVLDILTFILILVGGLCLSVLIGFVIGRPRVDLFFRE